MTKHNTLFLLDAILINELRMKGIENSGMIFLVRVVNENDAIDTSLSGRPAMIVSVYLIMGKRRG